jgi:hypothetical protein
MVLLLLEMMAYCILQSPSHGRPFIFLWRMHNDLRDQSMTHVFTKESIDKFPIEAVEMMFALQPTAAMNMVMAMFAHPFMAELGVRSLEAGAFNLNPEQSEKIRQALSCRETNDLLERFDRFQKNTFHASGKTAMDRAIDAIEKKDLDFFSRAVREIDGLNQMLTPGELPEATKLATKMIDGLERSKITALSRGGALLMASAKSENRFAIQGQELMSANLDVSELALQAKIKGIGLVNYSHADLIVRSMATNIPSSDALVRAALKSSQDPEKTKDAFAQAFHNLVVSKRDGVPGKQAENLFDELLWVKMAMMNLLSMGIFPKKETLDLPMKIDWKPLRNGLENECFEGPFRLCIPMWATEMQGKLTNELNPVSLWFALANENKLQELKEFSQRGFDVSECNPFNGFTAMHGTHANKSLDIVNWLVRIGTDDKAQDLHRKTPRDWRKAQSPETVDDFDSVVQAAIAVRTMDGILKGMAPKVGPEI